LYTGFIVVNATNNNILQQAREGWKEF